MVKRQDGAFFARGEVVEIGEFHLGFAVHIGGAISRHGKDDFWIKALWYRRRNAVRLEGHDGHGLRKTPIIKGETVCGYGYFQLFPLRRIDVRKAFNQIVQAECAQSRLGRLPSDQGYRIPRWNGGKVDVEG